MKVIYQPIYDVETLCQKIQEESNKEENDFVEGLAYSLNESVLVTSLLTDHCEKDKVACFLESNLNCFNKVFGHLDFSFVRDFSETLFVSNVKINCHSHLL